MKVIALLSLPPMAAVPGGEAVPQGRRPGTRRGQAARGETGPAVSFLCKERGLYFRRAEPPL
ncbi:MAG: hypothetical protein HY579_02515 [Nitrospinae bacterium]|nr:hypothetical protein [Nitrospinota bacterium]